MPASAIEAPINFRKPRRETPSSHSDAPLGNSRCIISRNSSLPASSSRLRQYSGPLVCAILSRTVCSRCLVPHVEDLITWPKILFGSTMAVQAPLHLQGRIVVHQRHAIHGPVTGVATYSFVDVNAVIEVNKVRQIVDASPNQRF